MIVASKVLCNSLFLKASVKNKRVGFVLEQLVSLHGKTLRRHFFRISSVRKEFVYSSFYHQTLHLFMIETSLKHHKGAKP